MIMIIVEYWDSDRGAWVPAVTEATEIQEGIFPASGKW